MELLVFVGALVALAVAPHLWGDDSRDWERGAGLFDVDYFIEDDLRGHRAWLDRRAALLAQLRSRGPTAPRAAVLRPAALWLGRGLVRWGVALQRRYALTPAHNLPESLST